MKNALVFVDSGAGRRSVALADYLDAAQEEHALEAAHAWIKQLRLAKIDGEPLRRRFTVRGDSLWWFAELYLHKQQVILSIFRTLAALERFAEAIRPQDIRDISGGPIVRAVGREFARVHGIRSLDSAALSAPTLRLTRLDMRARALRYAALASRLRSGNTPPRPRRTAVAAFIHRAFWRSGSPEGSAESYIGPVLTALEQRLSRETMYYVGVGPSENFGARRWWHPLRAPDPRAPAVPVEAFAPLSTLRDAHGIWQQRHAFRRALWSSPDIRDHAVISGCNLWAIIGEELAGIALLQWPWSVRAMDEAGAVLDTLRPETVLTYAEAGGWGRALIMEARRRGISSAGLQHGFIYRHWLNYRHEADEMAADPDRPDDIGFPRPTVTLLFDESASQHLQRAGRFPAESLAVTGSPRLDALVAAATRLSPEDLARAREAAGAGADRALVLVVTKYREARHLLRPLIDAASADPRVHLAIKTHPAETPEAYRTATAGRRNVRVLPASAPLAPLLCASRAIVTVNSTVALDAAVLGVPSLVIGLPNNLTPFVDAGAFAGARSEAEIHQLLNQILYDEEFRLQLERARCAFLARFAIGADGAAADRSANAVLELLRRRGTTTNNGSGG